MKLKHRKWNTESTIGERLRLLVGSAMSIVGLMMLLFGNFSGDGMYTWLIGLGLLIGGLIVAKSVDLLMGITG
jgi:hypothetical protein